MKKYMGIVLSFLALLAIARADTLKVTQDSIVIEGGSYDRIILDGRKYITLRNVTIKNTIGTNFYAGVQMKGCKYVTMDRCEVDGGANNGSGTCGAVKLDGASRVLVRDCKIHNANDDGFRVYSSTFATFWDNEIYHLVGCGTDNGCSDCNNGHSDGFQIMACIRVDVRRNLVYDVKSTSAFNVHDNSRFVDIFNNIFYGPNVGLPCYLHDAEDIKFYNNVVWGRDQGGYGGLAVGGSPFNRVEIYNNIIWNINTSHLGFTNNSSLTGDYNLLGENTYGAWPKGAHDVVNNAPFTVITAAPKYGSVLASDFHLKSGSAAIDKGTSGFNAPDIDFYSKARTGTMDIGPMQYGVSGKKPRVWFTASNREGAGPLNVTFTNSSPADFTGWQWDFGDGGTSTSKNPSHTYTGTGKYSPKLIGTGSGGLVDTLQVQFYVNVSGTGMGTIRTPGNILNGLTVFPDPMVMHTDFYFPRNVNHSITIFDSFGNAVRHLAGRRWDGRDDHGMRLGSGLYLYRITADHSVRSGRIMKVQ